MPKKAAANGAKNSTSIATRDFLVVPYYPDAITTLKRAIWRIAYRTRRAIHRKFSTSTYAIERRAEIARCKAEMHPIFQFVKPQ